MVHHTSTICKKQYISDKHFTLCWLVTTHQYHRNMYPAPACLNLKIYPTCSISLHVLTLNGDLHYPIRQLLLQVHQALNMKREGLRWVLTLCSHGGCSWPPPWLPASGIWPRRLQIRKEPNHNRMGWNPESKGANAESNWAENEVSRTSAHEL